MSTKTNKLLNEALRLPPNEREALAGQLFKRRVSLFNPRTDAWDEHFEWEDAETVRVVVRGRFPAVN